MKKVYIFRGSPASGKSTIVPEFCKKIPGPVALIEHDTFRWNFHKIGRSIGDISDDEHKFALSNMELIFEQYLKNGKYNVVVEGLFTWNNTTSSQGSALKLTRLAERHGFEATSIVLKADKTALLNRNSQRPYVVPPAEFDNLYDGIYSDINEQEVVIDSTNQTPSETLDNIIKASE